MLCVKLFSLIKLYKVRNETRPITEHNLSWNNVLVKSGKERARVSRWRHSSRQSPGLNTWVELKSISALILFVYKLMIGSSKNSTENYPRKCFWTQDKETRVIKALISLRTSRPWGLSCTVRLYILKRLFVLVHRCHHSYSCHSLWQAEV